MESLGRLTALVISAGLCVSFLALAATAWAATQPAGPAARQDAWRIVGPGGGGTMITPVISPLDSAAVIEHCDMTGGYITRDNGLSWRMFNLGTGLSSYAFDPNDANVIYAGNTALWRSEDQGKSWEMILPDPRKKTTVHMRGDHSSFDLTTEDANYPRAGDVSIDAIAIDPKDSKKVFLIISGELLLSADRCKSWIKVRKFDGDILFTDVEGKTGAFTVVTSSAVYVAEKSEWRSSPSPVGTLSYATGGHDAEGKLVIYATAQASWSGKNLDGGILATRDAGKTWEKAAMPIGKLVVKPGEGDAPSFTSIGCCAQHAETVYVGFDGLMAEGAPKWGFCGVAKSVDGDKTWTLVKKEGLHKSENAQITWIEERMEENIAKRGEQDPNVTFWPPRDIGVAPTNADICYIVDLFRTYRTLDGGKTWKTVNSVKVYDDAWTTTGLDVTTCYGVHFDPKVKERLYITYTDIGLFRSEDGGKSWIPSTTGIPLDWRNTTYWLAFDPDVKGLMWGAFSSTHDLPRPKMWRHRRASGYEGGVAVSTDGGATWTVSNIGMKETAVTDILVDPASPQGKRTLYACGFGTGVWKSVDNGRSWRKRNTGIDFPEPFAWRIVRADDGTLYLLIARRNEMAGSDPSEGGALYKSTDGADTWQRLPLPDGTNAPNGLAIDPRDNKRMYLAAWGVEYKDAHDTGGGIFLSQDGGKTWVTLKDDDQHIYDVTVDPKKPDTLYACGFDSAAYRSTDAGKTWNRLKGYNFKWGHRVLVDQNNLSMVYITTFGGSVWHGPAGGDRSANDDWGMSLPKEP